MRRVSLERPKVVSVAKRIYRLNRNISLFVKENYRKEILINIAEL